MINIYYHNSERGPGKVINNLTKGLNELSIPFKKNGTDKSWKNLILQDHPALYDDRLENSLIGPNVCVIPVDNHIVLQQKYKKILVPSEWVKNLYKRWVNEDKILVWPVGIDTEKFENKKSDPKVFDCLIYSKNRTDDELGFVTNFLTSKNQTYNVIKYGHYYESNFIDLISKSKYGFVLANTESQGIAIQEMISCNLPLLVWDVVKWVDRGVEYEVDATSVPYWDSSCGLKIYNRGELESSYDKFITNLDKYNPRDFIVNNLSIKKQTNDLVNNL